MPDDDLEPKPQPYFGSVRFFKHVIITIFVLIVTVPTLLAVVFGVQNALLRGKMEKMAENPSTSLSDETEPQKPKLDAVVPEWQSLYPKLYADPEAKRSTVDEEKTVYLTFDDGPSVQTPQILEILKEYNVKATFFVVGHDDEQSRQRMKAVVDAGHAIGVHTYSHDYKTIYSSVSAYLDDFNRQYELIHEATGVYPQIFRFPGGSINGYNGVTYQEIISEMVRRGFVYFDWNVATGDAVAGGNQDKASLTANALKSVDSLRRSVLLMHDSADKVTTVEALPDIIEGYQDAGFTFEVLTPEVVPVVYGYPDDGVR